MPTSSINVCTSMYCPRNMNAHFRMRRRKERYRSLAGTIYSETMCTEQRQKDNNMHVLSFCFHSFTTWFHCKLYLPQSDIPCQISYVPSIDISLSHSFSIHKLFETVDMLLFQFFILFEFLFFDLRPFLIGRVKYEFRGFMFSKLVFWVTYKEWPKFSILYVFLFLRFQPTVRKTVFC